MSTSLAELDLRVTMADALSDLIAAYQVSGHSPRTIELFETHITKLMVFANNNGSSAAIASQSGQSAGSGRTAQSHRSDVYLDDITASVVTKFLATEKLRGLKASSLHLSLRTIRTFLAFHVEQGNLTGNAAKLVKMPRVVVEPVKFLSDDEIASLLRRTAEDKTVEGVRDVAMLRVLMDTGVRRGELIGMQVEDVSLDERTIVVRAATSKTRKGRTVPISKTSSDALRTYLRVRAAYLKRMKTDDYGDLWVAAKGPLSGNGTHQALQRRLTAAGLPHASLHSFRHRMAARAIEKGLPMPYLVKVGGWANAVMPTSRYGQWAIEERALTAMQELLDR